MTKRLKPAKRHASIIAVAKSCLPTKVTTTYQLMKLPSVLLAQPFCISILIPRSNSVLNGAKSTQQLFESRWKNFSDYIEVSMLELAAEGTVSQINPYSASLMFQGLMRELLYAKCIYFTERYRDIPLKTLVKQQVKSCI